MQNSGNRLKDLSVGLCEILLTSIFMECWSLKYKKTVRDMPSSQNSDNPLESLEHFMCQAFNHNGAGSSSDWF